MADKNLVISKEKYESQKNMGSYNRAIQELNNYLSQKKIIKKMGWAKIGYWIGLSFWVIGLILSIAFSILIPFYYRKQDGGFWQNHSDAFFGTFYGIGFVLLAIGLIIYFIGRKDREFLQRDIIVKFDRVPILVNMFKYFGLEYREAKDENGNIDKVYKPLNFFKNIHNFNNWDSSYAPVNGKYEQYNAANNEEYIKLQNLEYSASIWVKENILSKKELRKLLRTNSASYKDLYERKKTFKRFGIAVKLWNLNPQITLTMFDKNDNYTPEGFHQLKLEEQYQDLYIKTNNPEALASWAQNKNNLDFISEIYQDLSITKISTINNKKENSLPLKNPSLLIRNQEAFIWFDTPEELLDLQYVNKSLDKNTVAEILSKKLNDDLYVVYLALQLLVPFGLKIGIHYDENEDRLLNERLARTSDLAQKANRKHKNNQDKKQEKKNEKENSEVIQ